MPPFFDLAIDDDGDLLLNATSTDLSAAASTADDVKQRLTVAFNTLLGTWEWNLSTGLPFLDWARFKPAPEATVSAYLKDAILSTEGVARLVSYEQTLTARRLSATFTVETSAGDTLAATLLLDEQQRALLTWAAHMG